MSMEKKIWARRQLQITVPGATGEEGLRGLVEDLLAAVDIAARDLVGPGSPGDAIQVAAQRTRLLTAARILLGGS